MKAVNKSRGKPVIWNDEGELSDFNACTEQVIRAETGAVTSRHHTSP
jgi:hypothetical protein